MSWELWLIFVIIWLFIGMNDAGSIKAYIDHKYGIGKDCRYTRMIYIIAILAGPLSVPSTWVCGMYGYGWKWPFSVD